MKKSLFIISIITVIVLLTACHDRNASTIQNTIHMDESTKQEVNNETTNNRNLSLEKKDGAEKIKEILELEQQNGSILGLSFFYDYLYLVIEKEKIVYLQQYNMNNWEKKEVITNLSGGQLVSILPKENGIELSNMTSVFERGNKYIYNHMLELAYQYEDISGCSCVFNNVLYVYESSETGEGGVLYRISNSAEKKEIVRDFNVESIHGYKIATLYEFYISEDGKNLYFKCSYWNKELTETKRGWGILNLEDSNQDILYTEFKHIQQSQNGILITDEMDNDTKFDEETLINQYEYIDNRNEKTIKYFINKEESLGTVLSYEGNILLTTDKSNTIRVYDLFHEKVLYEHTDENNYGAFYAKICEKYKLFLNLIMIQESDDYYSPTGKYEIIIERY